MGLVIQPYLRKWGLLWGTKGYICESIRQKIQENMKEIFTNVRFNHIVVGFGIESKVITFEQKIVNVLQTVWNIVILCRQWYMDSALVGVRLSWAWIPFWLFEQIHSYCGRNDKTCSVHSKWTCPSSYGDCWYPR